MDGGGGHTHTGLVVHLHTANEVSVDIVGNVAVACLAVASDERGAMHSHRDARRLGIQHVLLLVCVRRVV